MKRALILFLLAAFLLTGCSGGEPASAQGSSDISDSETEASSFVQTEEMTREAEETVEADSAGAESELTAETESDIAEETESSEPTEGNASEQARLERLILSEDEPAESLRYFRDGIFRDLDGDGVNELVTFLVEGGYDSYLGTELWFASGDFAQRLDSSMQFDEIELCEVQGDTLLLCGNNTQSHYGSYTGVWRIADSRPESVDIDGFALTRITYDEEYGEFVGWHSVYDGYNDGAGFTRKPYWYSYNADTSTLVQYDAEEISVEKFGWYTGGKEVLQEFFNTVGSDYGLMDILKYENGVICLNYTDPDENNKSVWRSYYCSFRIHGARLIEITPKDNRGRYLTAEKYAALSADNEQARLAELIWNIIPAEDRGGEFNIRPIFFGDYDGDGTEELLAAYGIHSETGGSGTWYVSGLYFASGDTARMLRDGVERMMSEPRVIWAGGDTLFTMEFMYPTGSRTEAWVLENGGLSPVTIDSAAQMELTQTDGCEFTALHSTYDWYTFGAGHTWKPYFLYYSPERNRFEQHKLREIASEEFAQAYDGTEEILKRVSDEGGEVCNILRGDNGVIYVNYLAEKKFAFFTFSVNGRQLADITHEDNRGYYIADVTLRQRELEQLILDSIPAEDKREGCGIADVLYGDLDRDGTGELFLTYGGEWNTKKVWFASDEHAECLSVSGSCGDLEIMETPDGVFVYTSVVGVWGTGQEIYYLSDSRAEYTARDGGYSSAPIWYSEESGEYVSLLYSSLFAGHIETRYRFDKESNDFVSVGETDLGIEELKQEILNSIPYEDKREGYELINPIADDFDGDGHGELLAIYGNPSQEDKTLGWGDVWFAGIHGAQRLYSTWYYESPALATSDGVFLCCVCPGPQGEELRPWYIEDSTPYPAAPEGSSALASLNYDEETGEYICRVTTANMLEAAELFGDILETETLRCTFDKEQRRLVDLS